MTPSSIGTSFYDFETEEGSEAQIYTELVRDLQERLKTLRQERQTIEEEQGDLATVKKNFEFFLACLKELPDTNSAGMPLKVNGLDVQGTLMRDAEGNQVYGVCEDNLSGYAMGPGQYISSGGKKHPRTAACELRFIFTVFSGKRISSERNNQPHKAPVWRRNVLCGKFLGLVNKTRQWGSVRGVWRSRQKEAHRVTVQDAYKAARWNVTGWAGDSLDESTQQNSDYNHS